MGPTPGNISSVPFIRPTKDYLTSYRKRQQFICLRQKKIMGHNHQLRCIDFHAVISVSKTGLVVIRALHLGLFNYQTKAASLRGLVNKRITLGFR